MSCVQRIVRIAIGSLAALLAACSSAPPPPGWQGNAKAALDRAVAAYLGGDTRIASVEFDLARHELASTGRGEQVALAELTRCAARVASLDVGPCEGFEKLRPDATTAQRAYADYLANRVQAGDVALLPEQHRAFAAGGLSGDAATSALRAVDDPLARLVATGVLFQGGRANPAAVALAADTASAQGWRRPLLAWLGVQLALAEKAGDNAGAELLRRRIGLVEGAR
ncbi:MAG: hypothetical protein OEW34_11850 [Burkholderiaceae bacterium]|nr:hypothetical protein [Burkholderiaceae bacterium]